MLQDKNKTAERMTVKARRSVQFYTAFSLSVLIYPPLAFSDEDCTPVLLNGRAGFETNNFLSNTLSLNNFLCANNAYSEENFQKISHLYQWRSDFNLPTYFSGTGNADVGDTREEYRKISAQNFLCHSEDYGITDTATSRQYVSALPDAIAEKWLKCMELSHSGLRLSYTFTNDKQLVMISYLYNRTDGGPPEAVVDSTDPVQESRNLNCTLPEQGDKILNERHMFCTRDPYRQSEYTINVNGMGSKTIIIPALPPPIKPDLDINGSILTDAKSAGSSGQARMLFLQKGPKVTWALAADVWQHRLEGVYVNSNTFIGTQDKVNNTITENIPPGCHIYSIYTVNVIGTFSGPHLVGTSEIVGGDVVDEQGKIARRNVSCKDDPGLRCNVSCGPGPGIDSTITPIH